MTSHFNDPAYWRERADELRAVADNLADPTAKAQIMACAKDYDLLAERAEARSKSGGISD